MTAPLIISISGMRGIVGQSLGPRQASDYGLAFGTWLKRQHPAVTPKVCLGRDSRPSGPMLAAALSAGLMAAGCDVIDLGIVTTPGAALMTRFTQSQGGVVITASHNPVPWNGIKLLSASGVAFPSGEVRSIQQLYFDQNFDPQDALGVGNLSQNTKTHAVHVDTTLQFFDKTLIKSKRFKVVLDSVNGAGCIGTAELLGALGCTLIHLNERPTGLFAHTPEPTAENLKELGPQILKHKAQVGFAQDPDADRLAIIDEKGAYIGEEYTLALAAKYMFGKKKGVAAVNLSTSRMIDAIAEQTGCQVLRTPVGEAHVANAMIQNGCIMGGEGNGGVIDLRVVPVRDSFVGIAMVLQLMAETGKSISQLVAEIPRFEMIKTKMPCPLEQAGPAIERVKNHYLALQSDSVRVDIRDGIRIDLPEGWVQLRASNTEPIIRIIAESADQATSRRLIAQIETLFQA